MVFKRYANPFSLFDNLIENKEFNDYIVMINSKYIEELEYDVWLHRPETYGKSFDDFKKDIHLSKDAQAGYMDGEDVKTTLRKSNDILSNFKPQ